MHRPISARRLAVTAGVVLILSAVPAVFCDDGFAADENPFATSPPAEEKAADAQPETDAEPLKELKVRSALKRFLGQRERAKKDRPRRDSLPVVPVQRSRDKLEQSPDALLPGNEFPRVGPILEDPLNVVMPALPEPAPLEDRVEPEASPSQLKKLKDILPFHDYEPDEAGEEAPQYPEEVPLGDGPYEGRSIDCTTFHWEASNLYHNPLYFEDAPLERYGHTHHEVIQPFVSAGKFGVQLLGLPYQMTIDPVCKRMYTLGWYRPGECAPYKHYQIPLNAKAAAVEAGFMTGMFYLFP